jgi:hypothetical protein
MTASVLAAAASELERLRKAARLAKQRVRALKDELKAARKAAKQARKRLRKAAAAKSKPMQPKPKPSPKLKPQPRAAKKPAKTAQSWKHRRIRAAKPKIRAAAPQPATVAADAGADALGSVEALTPSLRSGIE